MPIYYYICTNLNPAVDDNPPASSLYVDVFSILLHVFIKIKIYFYKSTGPGLCCLLKKVKFCYWVLLFKEKNIWYKYISIIWRLTLLFLFQPTISTTQCINLVPHNLIDLTTHLALTFVLLLHTFLFLKTNQLSVAELNAYPYYLLMYTFQFTANSVLCSVGLILQYVRHSQMRKTLLMEFNNDFNCMK